MGRCERGDYPTDFRGFPVPINELNFPEYSDRQTNTHHLAFTKNTFGRLAIAQTFRNLEAYQEVLPIRRHDKLHQLYDGISLPEPVEMLDRIQEAYELDEKLKLHTPKTKGYQIVDIDSDRIERLHREYNFIRHKL